jgi:hypothetical protein
LPPRPAAAYPELMSPDFIIAMHRKRLIRKFRAAGATSPARAVSIEFLGERANWIFRGMAKRGVFLPARDGLYYMDEPAADEYLRRRWIRLRILDGLALLALLIWALAHFARH